MSGPMGRRRQSHLELPPHMYLKRGRYYYGRAGIALGPRPQFTPACPLFPHRPAHIRP